ncbi:MAG: hypothetical protein DRN20_06120 [Thermoplasmata archaeon]|mgnify:CR=1 FL=1|nr:MAG: hypothetical protein DRN20_06120 [Thermoplasmata archaeon]
MSVDSRRVVSMLGISLLLAVLSIILPWWGISIVNEWYSGKGKLIEREVMCYGYSLTGGLRVEHIGGASLYAPHTKTTLVFFITTIFLTLTLFLLLIAIIQIVVCNNGNLHRIVATMIGVSLVLSAISPLFFMITLPMAVKEDVAREMAETNKTYEEDEETVGKTFFGHYTTVHEEYLGVTRISKVKWGGDVGWFLAWLTPIFIAVALAFIIAGEKRSKTKMQGSLRMGVRSDYKYFDGKRGIQ